MSLLDDWSPPVSPSLIAAMEQDIIPETCPSQLDNDDRRTSDSPAELSDLEDMLCRDEEMLDDLSNSALENNNLSDAMTFSNDLPGVCQDDNQLNEPFQTSPVNPTELDSIPETCEIMVDRPQIPDEPRLLDSFCCKRNRGMLQDRIEEFKRFILEPARVLSLNTNEVFWQTVVDVKPENLTCLFYSLKQCISKIIHNRLPSDSDFKIHREQIILFYAFLKNFLNRLPEDLSDEEEDIIQRVISHLHSTVLYVDRLSDIRFDLTLSASHCEYHKFHLNLDLYWNTIEILYLLEKKYCNFLPVKKLCSSYYDGENESRLLLPQMIQIFIWELVSVAMSKFQNNSSDLIYSCSCIRDIWKLLACVLKEKEENIWMHLHSVIQILLDTEVKVPDDIEIDCDVYMYPQLDQGATKDHSKFCMWILTNVALLINGGENKVTDVSDYYDVNVVVKKFLNKGDSCSEMDLRFYLRCCQQLASVWEPNINLLVLFWDYFYKLLNNSFQLKTVTVENLQTISKTPIDLLERCKQYTAGTTGQKQNETSYQLYLGLLAGQLKSLVQSSSIQEWKQMKGRIYSKFHKRRIQELSETGLNNFTCLFLCLALTADLEDVSTKLCGFYEMVEVSRQNVQKTITTWKGMYALMLLYIQKDINFRFIATKLANAFSNICLEFEVFDSDPEYRHNLWKLINVYLDGTQEIFDASSNLNLSQDILICEGYAKVLHVCRNNEVPTIITGLQEITNKLRMVCVAQKRDVNGFGSEPTDHTYGIYPALFNIIYPALKDLCQSQTAKIQLADMLAELSLLALECKPDDYFTIIRLMLHSENINKNLVCRYLSHIVTVDHAMDLLSGHMTNYQTILIQTWIRSAVFVPSSSQQLQALNRSMINLPDIQSILHRASYIIPSEPDKIVFHIFKAVQKLYEKLENWKDKIELRDQMTEYVKDIHRQLIPYMQTLQPVESLSTAYTVVGYLIKCCAHLLYVKSKPNCPLPDIINTMIVPHTLLKKDKPPSPVFLSLVRDHLHLFVSGMANLDFKRDPFIQRRLKDIVNIYLIKFWNTVGSTSFLVHPLVMSLKGSFIRQPSESSVSFRQYILELVKESFMMASQTYNLPENYQTALYFTRDTINRTINKEVIARDLCILLSALLTIYLQCDSVSTQQLCQTLLQIMVDAGQSHQNIATKDIIGDQIMAFIGKFKKVKLNHAMKTLEKIPKSGACYIHKALPRIEHTIVEHESFRAAGQDLKLRQTYQSLIQLFGTT